MDSDAQLTPGDDLRSFGIGHRLVRADAGTGKTYSLALQYLRLLAAGVDPARIVAATFTRKAAGEILERVLLRLAEAVLDPQRAAVLAQELNVAERPARAGTPPHLTPQRLAAHWLEQLVRALPRLQISTLDAFFFRVVSGFRFEMGMGRLVRVGASTDPGFEALRRAAIERLLQQRGRRERDLEALTELVTRLYRRDAARSVARSLDVIVRELEPLYREARARAVWNGVQHEYRLLDEAELHGALGRLEERIAAHPTGHKGFDRALRKKVEELRRARWQDVFTGAIGEQWVRAPEQVTFHRKPLPSAVRGALLAPMDHAAAALLVDHNERTRATWEVLNGFEQHWEPLLRRLGFAVFDELVERTALFLRSAEPPQEQGEEPGQEAGEQSAAPSADLSLQLLYRLDTRVEHLLLDEFQDTSRGQWRALRPLTDEILAWGDGSRSLFSVGDPKQAIYGWRGGCVELFDQLEQQITEAGGTTAELSASYRSAPQVIEAVNRVFGDLARQAVFNDEQRPAVERWSRRFAPHATALHDLPGVVRLQTTLQWEGEFPEDDLEWVAEPGEDGLFDDEDDRPTGHLDAVALRIRELVQEGSAQGAAPGLGGPAQSAPTLGVLTATNRTASDILQRLRRVGVAASGEGGATLDDDPAVLAVFSALRLAEHPGDSRSAFFLAHVELAQPMAQELGIDEKNWQRPQAAAARVRALFAALGAGRLVARWRLLLLPGLAPRSAQRLQQLLEVAEAFEEEPLSSPGELVEYALGLTLEEPSPAPVRVMTVHKAKGLEFDRVVLCELERRFANLNNPLAEVLREHPVLPPSAVHRYSNKATRALSEELERAHQQEVERRLLDDLSSLYVALTRARKELLLLVQPLQVGKQGPRESDTFARLLRDTLCPEASDEQRARPDAVLYSDGVAPRQAAVGEEAETPPADVEPVPEETAGALAAASAPADEGPVEECAEGLAAAQDGEGAAASPDPAPPDPAPPDPAPPDPALPDPAPPEVTAQEREVGEQASLFALFDETPEAAPEGPHEDGAPAADDVRHASEESQAARPAATGGSRGGGMEQVTARQRPAGSAAPAQASAGDASAASSTASGAGEKPSPPSRRAPRPLRPSELAAPAPRTVAELFELRPSDAALRGRVVHGWLAQCRWLERPTRAHAEDWPLLPAERRRVVQRLGVRISADQAERWWHEFRAALLQPHIAALFSPPEKRRGEKVEIWVERPFATLRAVDADAGGAEGAAAAQRLLRGTFDRVELVRRGAQISAARVVDFKTDSIARSDADPRSATHSELVSRYRPQLLAYRDALATMLQLLPTHVQADLAFLSSGQVVRVDG